MFNSTFPQEDNKHKKITFKFTTPQLGMRPYCTFRLRNCKSKNDMFLWQFVHVCVNASLDFLRTYSLLAILLWQLLSVKDALEPISIFPFCFVQCERTWSWSFFMSWALLHQSHKKCYTLMLRLFRLTRRLFTGTADSAVNVNVLFIMYHLSEN